MNKFLFLGCNTYVKNKNSELISPVLKYQSFEKSKEKAKISDKYLDITKQKSSRGYVITKNKYFYRTFIRPETLKKRLNSEKQKDLLRIEKNIYLARSNIEFITNFSNIISLNQIIDKAKKNYSYFSLIGNREKRSVIVTENNFVYLTNIKAKTLIKRL
jgi:regulator of extracellular matrix RemA (YlzA/DUF370 family)